MLRALLIATLTALAAPAGAGDSPKVYTKTVLSKPLAVQGIIKSMEGPDDIKLVTMKPNVGRETLVWITGFKSAIVENDGRTPADPEFMCHTNLDYDYQAYQDRILGKLTSKREMPEARMFTLSPGAVDVHFPEGFGIPMPSHQPLWLAAQVLNHNDEDADTEVRQKVTISYVRDEETAKPMVPLYTVAAQGLKLISGETGRWNISQADEEEHGPSCLPGQTADHATPQNFRDDLGQQFTGHWVVEPGVEVNHNNVTHMMALEADTTLHYANVHLHAFAESIELRDVTAGKTVFEAKVTPVEHGVGVAHMEEFSSAEGVPLYKDHQYTIVTRYNNTSGKDQDAMALMMLYLRDTAFDKEKLELHNQSAAAR